MKKWNKKDLKGWIWTFVVILIDLVLVAGGAYAEGAFTPVTLAISIAISCYLCFFGEWIVRLRYGAKKVSSIADGGRLAQVFEEVHKHAEKESPYLRIFPAEIYVVPGQEINAFAAGSKTVMITEGALQLDTGYQKALIAHELGHLAAGHGCLSLMIAANVMLLSIGYTIMRFTAVIFAVIISLVSFTFGRQGLFSFFAAGKIGEVVGWVVDAVNSMYFAALDLVIAKLKRGCEYDADMFAARCGYGLLIRQVLLQFAAQEPVGKVRLRERIFAEHPGYEDRIRRLTAANFHGKL